ncbi:MAG TPA: histidine kinase dimerization/phospho-acceptor domain-containing protein [Pseudolabrys sp.]|nr:histidine kinase dimerization/phospho-acceptor domain-containing protein [Pseudolabrys sp.]
MTAIGFPLDCLLDPRLSPHAASPRPTWLWSTDGRRLLWANPVGAAIFGAPTPAATAALNFDATHTATVQIARLAASLIDNGAPRLERLRGFDARPGGMLTCACSRIALAGFGKAVLVVASERAGPDLPLDERTRRLFADIAQPVMAYAADGSALAATATLTARLAELDQADGADALVQPALVSDALMSGSATGDSRIGPLTLTRIGEGASTLVLAMPQMARPAATPTDTLSTTEPRQPLRFVWSIDDGERFAFESDEFASLIGPATTQALHHPWSQIAAQFHLDPHGEIAGAIAARQTFSRHVVPWPVDGSDETLPVELSGLPMFDRERNFRGYRGFGICRDVVRLAALATARALLAPAAADRPPDATPPEADEQPSPVASEPPTLSPGEALAFDELARRLGDGLKQPPSSGDPILPPAEDIALPAEAAALQRAQDRIRELETILDTATDGVILLDRNSRILSANHSAQALFGYDAADFEGLLFGDLFAPESRGAALAYLDRLTGSGSQAGKDGLAALINEGRDVIGRVRRGGLLPLFMTLGAISAEGEDSDGKLCAVFRDLTAWKKTEEELMTARQQAEKTSTAKSEFLAKVSHEIRSPLNAIIGFSDMMIDERFGPVGNERYRDYLKDIRAAGTHLIALLDDLLDLSKIESGQFDLTFAALSLNDLAQQSVAAMQPQANHARIIIRTALAEALPPIVADARSMRQIILNLLSNSVALTGAGGQIIVSTTLTDAGEVALRVRDTGVGLSEQDLATTLDPFHDMTTRPRWGDTGTGLGLPITRALAQANRAVFRISSAVDSGTLVEIAFPASRQLAQ